MEFYPFGLKHQENQPDFAPSSELLGGKGAGLVWMSNQGVPVPPGFIISTAVWQEYVAKPKTTMKAIAKALPHYLDQLRAHFGYLPLLAVRSGARVSCPGMMDTILNVGLDDNTLPFWTQKLGVVCTDNSRHRLITMYGSVVRGIRRQILEPDLLTAIYEYKHHTGEDFPDAESQLLGAIEAVFDSWNNERANQYRKLNNIPHAWGTAVTVQAMVFGNLNDSSGTGVLFTRNPDTGEKLITGEFLVNAQGEDVVAGIRTPLPISKLGELLGSTVLDELYLLAWKLESLKQDMQDVEFTIQDGKLYLLQTRSAKRSAQAAIRIAVDLVKQGLIDAKTAVKRVTVRQFDQAQAAHLDPTFDKLPAFTGISACGGVVSGKPVFTKEDAINCKEPCILVTHETTPDDIAGMHAAVGVVTMVGGLTSHAAVVARGMNRACIVGVGQSVESFKDVEVLSLDGATGRIWTEPVPIIEGEVNGLIEAFSLLVYEALDVVPIIFDVPKNDLSQALLYLGDKVLDPLAAAKLVEATMLKVGKLYVDFAPAVGSAEAYYMTLFSSHQLVEQVLKALEFTASGMGSVMTDRLVLVNAESNMFKSVGIGKDLRSLIMASEEVSLEGLDTTDKAVQKVLAWKLHQDAFKMVSIGQRVTGMKSLLSIQQSMQLIAEGTV